MNDRTNGGPQDGPQPNRRRRTRAEERIASLDTSTGKLPQETDALRERLERVEQEAAENKAGWQRAAADFANYRRRTEQEREQMLGLANELLLRKLLAVVDDFDRALAAMPRELSHLGWIEGIWAIDRKLRALLESEGLTPIEAAGRPFDPREHEAVVHEETTSVPDGTVISELQRGYRIRDRVLRPALVTVAKNEQTTTNEQAASTNDGSSATDQSTEEGSREAASGGRD
jgi:molecular chaperone GrpE